MQKRRFHKEERMRSGETEISKVEQTWTLWKEELNLYNIHVKDFFRFYARYKRLRSKAIGKLTSRASQRYIMVHMKVCSDRVAVRPKWRGRATLCLMTKFMSRAQARNGHGVGAPLHAVHSI
ncbi:hypothetical protein PIB30_048610 [Stylosanthes scabra]|uniref:Uncharacterized protein n=1 Tax=Stylosanthes scabra TaxID=79078 RepID=A0ABU6RHP5_9FABA|nr:hypothetical protein [Stylosanthes scabra]